MKKILVIVSFSFASLGIYGQQNLASVNCAGAIPGCNANGLGFQISTNNSQNIQDFVTGSPSNPTTNPNPVPGNAGCLLSGETTSTFIEIFIVASGTLEWSIQGTQTGCFDWIMWPYTPVIGSTPSPTCGMLQNGTQPPNACNWNGACQGFTGMANPGNLPPGASQADFEYGQNVTAGQSFLLCLSNYSGTSQSVNLNFFGTAVVSCSPNTPDQTICLGTSATVNIVAPPNYVNPTFNWLVTNGVSNTSGGTNVSVTPTQTTEYHVLITDGPTGVSVVDTFTITTIAPPTPNAGPDATICLGQLIPLAGTQSQPGSTIGWTHSSAGITPNPVVSYAPNAGGLTPNVTVNQPGTYTFTFSENNGVCPAVTDQKIVLVSSTTHTTTWVGPSCGGMTNGSITIINPNATEYSFDGGQTWVTNATQTGFGVGTYVVRSRNQYGCFFTSNVTITAPAPILISAGNDTLVCENGTANLWASINVTGLNEIYHWSHNPAGTASTSTISPFANTNILVYAEAASGCFSDTAYIQVDVRPGLSGTISEYDTICPGYPTTIGVNGIAGGIGMPYDIVWSSGEVGVGTSMDITANPPSTLMYTATITDGCESTPLILTTEVYVAPVPIPTMAVVDDGICEPAVFELSITTDPAMVGSYVWVLSDGQMAANESPYFTDSMMHGSYNVQLIVTSPLGCIDSITNNNFITSFQLPVAQFAWSPNPVQMFNTELNFSNQTFLGAEYYWTFEDGVPAYSSLERPNVQFPHGVTGTYDVQLITISEEGCIDTLIRTITVLPEVLVFAPNSFTPDGDEFNQYWKVALEGIDVYSYHCEIYNRWGEMIFESKDLEVGWDGTYNGKLVEQGTYLWKITARDAVNDGKYVWNGNINVLR